MRTSTKAAQARGLARFGPLLVGLLFVGLAATIVVLVVRLRASPTWQVLPTSSASPVLVDGVAIDALDRARLGDWMQTAKELDTQAAQLSLQLREYLLCEVGPQTQLAGMKLPPAGDQSMRLVRGTVHVALGSNFPGALRIYTDHALVEVRQGTCVIEVTAQGTRVGTLSEGVLHAANAQQSALAAERASGLQPLAPRQGWRRLPSGAAEQVVWSEVDERILMQLGSQASERWNRGL